MSNSTTPKLMKNKRARLENESRSMSRESGRSAFSTSKKQKLDDSYNLIFKATTVDPSLKIICAFCCRDISRSIKIICAECHDTEYCIDCLALNQGKDGGNHKHDFHIADKLEFSVFNNEWKAYEELSLLSNIEKYGLDNWADISENMGTKAKLECEAHYYKFYYREKNQYLPCEKMTKKLDENSEIEKSEIRVLSQNVGKIPEFTTNKDNKNNRSRSLVKNRNRKDQTTITSASEVLGYWPKREEFDIEYLNDAELEIAELEFLDDDTNDERELKMNVLKVYNAQLEERDRRKKFVIERNLLDIKKQMNFERKLNKDDREIYNCLKPFARFMDNSSFHEMFEGIVLEKNLRQRLNQLKQYKKSGIKTYEEIEKYLEVESRNKKDDHKKTQMIFESCGLGGRINRYLQLGNEENAEIDANLREKNFIQSLGLSRSTYYDMKKRINKELLSEKDTKNILNKVILTKFDIDKDTVEGIIDFVVSLNNNEI